jgi:hypothetical protein
MTMLGPARRSERCCGAGLTTPRKHRPLRHDRYLDNLYKDEKPFLFYERMCS